MRYETEAELEALLATRYDGPLLEREGPGGMLFTYIPWTETVRRLNRVFGTGGWGFSKLETMFVDGVYTVSLLLTVEAAFEDGYWSKTVAGVGSAVAKKGHDDNSSKAALSDAISRAAKLLGDYFGFFLYEKVDVEEEERERRPAQNGRSSGYTGAATGGKKPAGVSQANAGKPASEPQLKLLERLGYEGNSAGLTMSQASAEIEKLKAAEAEW